MAEQAHSDGPLPRVNADFESYWAGAREGRLLLKRCRDCARAHFPPRWLCPYCSSTNVEWQESSGEGAVYSFTIMRRAPLPVFAPKLPYVVALVDLDEGARLMSNIVGPSALEVCIGERVSVFFEKRGEFAVPQFMRTSHHGAAG